MLELKKIFKEYKTGDESVLALNGVSLSFRKNEFVAVLGPSGCGKTTMLNIIGGLDHATSGDMLINGISTKKYKDRDWDSYRNHSVGFVFQSYNLIMHQSVISNVELALTLSGVSKSERRKRAKQVLEKVGLGSQMYKRPNQLSGGQMQRVAIARALINDPEILLADEPTGALDSETSVQIMEILKEIAKDRLIIMVTHNPELAEAYATRTVKLLDGSVVSDTDPYEVTASEGDVSEKKKKYEKKPSMSFFTALSLSFNNLLTKKARTVLTSFAGSIGIIGIALILSLSSGFKAYIDRVQEDTLSSYPIAIEGESKDYSALLEGFEQERKDAEQRPEENKIYSKDAMGDFFSMMSAQTKLYNLEKFKKYIIENQEEFDRYASSIQYQYGFEPQIYALDTSEGITQVNPSTVMVSTVGDFGSLMAQSSMMMGNLNVWSEMIDNRELLETQYDVVDGRWPEKYDEVVLIVDKNNEISDYTLYSLGLKDQADLAELFEKMMKGEEFKSETVSFTYDEILDLRFKLVMNPDHYVYDETTGKWNDIRVSGTEEEKKALVDGGIELKIVGILRPNENISATALNGSIGYLSALTEKVMEYSAETEIVKQQLADPDTDIFSGKPFKTDDAPEFDISALSPEEQMYFAGLSDAEKQMFVKEYMKNSVSTSTYKENAEELAIADEASPSAIYLYPVDFDSKDKLSALITEYNKTVDEDDAIEYTDFIGIFISSVSTIIDAITYVLIAFVSISLVVSSIMIGIITYISVLERTKEIGVLRAMGASKKDVSRVFNAETLIVGFVAGALGILITLLLLIPCNAIIGHFTGIANIAALPVLGAVILIAISVCLTMIAGFVPAKIAAKRDPVVALRTE